MSMPWNEDRRNPHHEDRREVARKTAERRLREYEAIKAAARKDSVNCPPDCGCAEPCGWY